MLENRSQPKTKGLPQRVLERFNCNYLDEMLCRHVLTDLVHQSSFVCPSCGKVVADRSYERYVTWGRIRCTCGRWFNARSGTLLAGSQLSARQVILLCLLLALGQDNQSIAYYVGVSSETVRCWRKELGHA